MTQVNAPVKNLLVIDSQISNWQSLAAGIGTDTSVLILDSGSDGLTQISDYLTTLAASTQDFVPLQSLQIISHGSAGSLLLGSSTLTSDSLKHYTSQLTSIGSSLTATGDILLYGCNVSSGQSGLDFINQFSTLTNADVAASNDVTGSVALGGNWVMEAHTGSIETIAINAVQYPDILGANSAPSFAIGNGIYTFTTTMKPIEPLSDQSILMADGKTLVMGSQNVDGNGSDFALARYNIDGSLDTSFGSNGKLTTDIAGWQDYASNMTLQTDGKILVVGESQPRFTSDINIAIVRYNSDGSLDQSFGSHGIVTPEVYQSVQSPYPHQAQDSGNVRRVNTVGNAIEVQDNSKILINGKVFNNHTLTWDFLTLRYNSDGTLDTSFNMINTLDGYPHYITNGWIPFINLDDHSNPTYIKNNSPVELDANVVISDAELDTANNYNGASLTLTRHGTANSEDQFSLDGYNRPFFTSTDVIFNNISVASYTQSGGQLVINFNAQATRTIVDSVLQTISYSNTSNKPPASVQIDWLFSDGNNGAQGTGGALTVLGSTTINITSINYAPTLTAFAAPVTSGNNTDSQIPVTFANLLAQGNQADSDGSITAFVIKAVSTGTLTIGTTAATATVWNANTNNTLDATHQAFWTPAPNDSGTLNAFTVVAKDNEGKESASAVQAKINTAASVQVTAGITPEEIGATGSFTFTLDSPAPAGGLTINYTLAGTATLNTDYSVTAGPNVTAVTGGSFTIAVGPTTATLAINAVRDGIYDPNETIDFTLVAGTDYIVNHTTGFAPKVDYATGIPMSVMVGDFNGDGKTDLAVDGVYNHTVSILLRNATNTDFDSAVNVTTGEAAGFVSVGDFNGDGKTDLAVTTLSSGAVSVLLRNAANTGFDSKVDVANGSSLGDFSVGDFNGDGKADLVVVNHFGDTVSVLLRNAANTGFDPKVDYATVSNVNSVSVGDFNGDGKTDLAVASGYYNTVSVLLRNAANTGFDPTVNIGLNVRSLTSVSIGDFNGDGKADLAVANSINVSVLLRNATNTGFDPIVDIANSGDLGSVNAGDFNGDGKADLAAPFDLGFNYLSVLSRNAANTGFDPIRNYATGSGSGSRSVSVGDFNGDGKADLAAANYYSNTVSVLLANVANTASLTITDNVLPPDTTPPTVTGFSPADGNTDAALASNIVLTFNETLQKGTGIIQLHSDSATGTVIESFDAASSNRLALSGNTLTIDPTNNLANSTQYFVTFDSGSVKDLAGNNYAGISSYDFTTVSSKTNGDDSIKGTSNDDVINALAGNDNIYSSLGNDHIDGGTGNDTLIYDFNKSAVIEVGRSSDGTLMIKSAEGTDTLLNIENLSFMDGGLSINELLAQSAPVPLFTSSASDGTSSYVMPTKYVGSVSFLDYQLLGNATGDVITGSTGNDFINLLGGDDAANGGAGSDVLDGGTGSNFLTGGSGNDTIFLDGRGGTTTWSTVTDFSAGDQVNIWGWNAGVSKQVLAMENQGADGYKGATFHYDLNNDGLIDTSITLTGLALSQVPAGVAHTVAGNGYLLIS